MTAEDTRSKARRSGDKPPLEPLEQHDMVAIHKQEMLKNLVREQVLFALGEPQNLFRVQVRPLWDGKYRVNIFVGTDAATAKIPHSYFIVADADGNVLNATPKIHKLY